MPPPEKGRGSTAPTADPRNKIRFDNPTDSNPYPEAQAARERLRKAAAEADELGRRAGWIISGAANSSRFPTESLADRMKHNVRQLQLDTLMRRAARARTPAEEREITEKIMNHNRKRWIRIAAEKRAEKESS